MQPTVRRFCGAAAAGTLAASLAVTGFTGPAAADDPHGELMIVMDASGSMDESDGAGGTRIEAARTAMHAVAQALPEESKAGLRAFGPESTGSGCEASDLVVPVGPVDREALGGAVDDLTPQGDTPIAHSLSEAADDFSDDEGPKTILLVSDGEETCDGDPAAVAEEITESGMDLRVHVIGFLVDDAARDQLVDVAQAGKGAYYDAQDGPALASRLQRASEQSLRSYDTTGTPVQGSPDGDDPPLLEPGRYVDTMLPNVDGEEPRLSYAFDLPEGTRAYVAATVPWSTPLEVDADNSLGVSLRPEATEPSLGVCERGTDFPSHSKGGSIPATATAQLGWDADAADDECGGEGRYVIEVDNTHVSERHGPAPLELTLMVEPAADNVDDLPEPYADADDPVVPDADGEPDPVVGSGSFGDAPIVEPGLYGDVLRPGERLYYRVPMDWGQRLSYEIELAQVDDEIADQLGGAVEIGSTVYNPMRADTAQIDGLGMLMYTGVSDDIDGFTAPVRYNNRDADDDATAGASIPGYYYISVRMSADADDPYFELPITLAVDVDGEVDGAPEYDDQHGLGTPAEQLAVELASQEQESADDGAADSSGPISLLWVAVATAGALSLAAVTVAWMLLRRKSNT